VYKSLAVCLPLCLVVGSDRVQNLNSVLSHPAQVSKDAMPVDDPIGFLKECLRRFDAENISGYEMIMLKQERLGGQLQPSEEIEVRYRTKPHSVVLKWLKGQRKANIALFVEGENKNMLLINPAGIAGRLVKVVERDPEGEDAKQSGRYSMREFGLRATMQRTLDGFIRARARGTSKMQYLGILKVKELNDRLCYAFKRIDAEPQEDGFTDVTVYIDKENWIQVGTLLKADDGKVIAEYLFRDIHLNPTFKPEQFTRAILTQ
jgi:Protein of unknown function (DUF1571)